MKVCLSFCENAHISTEVYGLMVHGVNNTFYVLKKRGYVSIETVNKGCTLHTYSRYRKVEMYLRREEGYMSDENGVFPVYYDVIVVAGSDKYRLRFKSEEVARQLISIMTSKGIATLNSSS